MSEKFETLADFVDWLVRLDLDHDDDATVHWFRGHPHRHLELRPGALRNPVDRTSRMPHNRDDERLLECQEQAINQQFRREAASMLADRLDFVELYFLAQHHGLPTRLLDWTTNGLAALFFTAVERPDEDGEVIVASPTWRLTTENPDDPRVRVLREAPFPQEHWLVVETVKSLFGDGDRPESGMILPVLPDLRSRRMLQQGACFTLHLPGSDAIDEKAVARLVVPRERKEALVASLRTLGITWSTLFPDLDHLCRELRARWSQWTESERGVRPLRSRTQ